MNIAPVPQEDGVSCGYCALMAVYNYYRLRDKDLRSRLGVDHGFLPCLPGRDKLEKFLYEVNAGIGKYKYSDSRGTSPPDMFAVLNEDGFKADIVIGTGREFKSGLRKHIASGHPALAVVDWWHWAVISGASSKGIWIVDSCRDEPYFMTYKSCSGTINGIILVSRKKNARRRPGNLACARGYLQGALFSMKMVGKEIPRQLDGFLKGGAERDISGTRVGNAINYFLGWKEGTSLGNWVNKTFG